MPDDNLCLPTTTSSSCIPRSIKQKVATLTSDLRIQQKRRVVLSCFSSLQIRFFQICRRDLQCPLFWYLEASYQRKLCCLFVPWYCSLKREVSLFSIAFVARKRNMATLDIHVHRTTFIQFHTHVLSFCNAAWFEHIIVQKIIHFVLAWMND